MAERARHADPVRTDEILVIIICWIVIKLLRIPLFLRLFIEGGIGKQAQADHAGGVAIIRSGRKRLAATPCANLDAGIFGRVLERVRRAVGIAHVEPQPKAVCPRSGGRREARLVHHAEPVPSLAAMEIWQARVARQRLEEIELAEGRPVHVVPQPVVSARPDDPIVAADDSGLECLIGRHAGEIRREISRQRCWVLGRPVIHVAKIIDVGTGQGAGPATDAHRFILDVSGAGPTVRQRPGDGKARKPDCARKRQAPGQHSSRAKAFSHGCPPHFTLRCPAQIFGHFV
jgi:hypothetical protein